MLQTIVVEVELTLNNRPLTYISVDIRDPQPLTSSHLLHRRTLTALPHHLVVAEDLLDPSYNENTRLSKVAKVQSLLDHFATRWKFEYLREYYQKSGNNRQDIKVGDVVLIHDEGPRLDWKLTVVEELIVGGDGLVQAAIIRTSSGKTNRPIVKLYPLEVSSSDENTSHSSDGQLTPVIQPDNKQWAVRPPPKDVGNELKHAYTSYYTVLCTLG